MPRKQPLMAFRFILSLWGLRIRRTVAEKMDIPRNTTGKILVQVYDCFIIIVSEHVKFPGVLCRRSIVLSDGSSGPRCKNIPGNRVQTKEVLRKVTDYRLLRVYSGRVTDLFVRTPLNSCGPVGGQLFSSIYISISTFLPKPNHCPKVFEISSFKIVYEHEGLL